MLKVIFFGTSDFAVSSLQLLLKYYNIRAVVTTTDKRCGRGNNIVFSAVKDFAIKNDIDVFQPEKLRDENFLSKLDILNADLYVVVAFRMLPKCVWNKARLGTINLHASLLPYYRGAAPINWAIINGEKKTGLTTFFIDDKIDTGSIILQEEERIFSVDTFETLYNRLKIKGAKLLLNTLASIEKCCYNVKNQDLNKEYKCAPKINIEDCKIDFLKSAIEIYNFVRGLSPEPSAWMVINKVRYKVLMCFPINLDILKPCEVISDGKNFLYIGTSCGVISISIIQPEGRKKMCIKEFLAGYWKKIKL